MQVHNEMFKLDPPITLDDFKHCTYSVNARIGHGRLPSDGKLILDLYWQNYGWGDPQKTIEMVVSLPFSRIEALQTGGRAHRTSACPALHVS